MPIGYLEYREYDGHACMARPHRHLPSRAFRCSMLSSYQRRSNTMTGMLHLQHPKGPVGVQTVPARNFVTCGQDKVNCMFPRPIHEILTYKPLLGKLSPTTSHLFKLTLPLPTKNPPHPPTVFLLHPSQPLSHLGALIRASLPKDHALSSIYFRSTSDDVISQSSDQTSPVVTSTSTSAATSSSNDKEVQWSDSTDVGDFVQSAARSSEFSVVIEPSNAKDDDTKSKKKEDDLGREVEKPTILKVSVPSFESRTFYMQQRLRRIDEKLMDMERIKSLCDQLAHRSAKRLALSGFGAMLVYWLLIARLTFWDYGW